MTSDVPGEDPGPTAIVEYEFTPEEGVRVLRWQFSQVVRLRRLVGMATLLAMAGVVLLVLANKSWYLGVIIIGVAILNLLWIGWSYYFATTRAWKKTGAAVGPKTMEFSDANVRVRTKKSDSVNQWTYYSEALERGDMYFLRLGKARAYLPVPKRAFRSIVDEVAFRSMAERHTSVSFTSGHPK